MTEMSLQFQQNLNEDTTRFSFTLSELAGLPEDVLGGLEADPADPSRRLLTLKYPHYVPAMRHIVSDSVRRQLQTAFDGRCGGHSPSATRHLRRAR
jgi:Zn-dependent oligopeptidase